MLRHGISEAEKLGILNSCVEDRKKFKKENLDNIDIDKVQRSINLNGMYGCRSIEDCKLYKMENK